MTDQPTPVAVKGHLRLLAMQHILLHPGCTSADVAGTIDATIGSVSGVLGDLAREGLLARYRDGRFYRYIYSDQVEFCGKSVDGVSDTLSEVRGEWADARFKCADLEKENETLSDRLTASEEGHALTQKYLQDANAQVLGLVAQSEALAAQVLALETWRDEALEKHPELVVVDPLLVQAREIVANIKRRENADPGLIGKLIAGDFDKILPVRSALAALRAATS